MKTKITLAAAMVLMTTAAATATDDSRTLTPDCEEALALSALPARLREGSSVYTLTAAGFELTRRGDGPFTCIVARNHKASIIPQCADREGADTVIPGIIRKSQWALAGKSADEQQAGFDKLTEQGELRAPARAGISYMLSGYNLIWSEGRQVILHVPPHVMYYAPNVSNEEVGGSLQHALMENRGTPYIVDVGIHGYMTSFSERASDSAEVEAACKGQVDVSRAVKLGEVAAAAHHVKEQAKTRLVNASR